MADLKTHRFIWCVLSRKELQAKGKSRTKLQRILSAKGRKKPITLPKISIQEKDID